MAPAAKENGGKARRKSFMHPLSRASPNLLPQINTDVGNLHTEKGDHKERKKLSKRSSIFGLGPAPGSEAQEGGNSSPIKISQDSPKTQARPRTLQKGRPSSIFGSLGRKSINLIEEKEEDNFASASPISPTGSGDANMPANSAFSRSVLYHGEIQTASGMFRKKKEYLVLTESHLVRFKSHARAAETFSSIPSQFGRNHNSRHPSSTSIGSLHEVQSTASHTSADNENRIPLQQIITIYKVEDGRPYFTMEVVYLDEEVHGAGSLQLILQDPKEADLWHTSIRCAAMKARLVMTEPYPERVIRYLVAAVEAVNDYSPLCFHVFRVVRRLSAFKGLRASQDDLQKVGNAVFYLVVGMNLVHLIPLPDFQNSSQELGLNTKKSRISFGIVSLVKCWVNYDDDRFQLEYRKPLMPAEILELASSGNPDIGYAILRVHHYLKPQWLDTTYNYRGPRPVTEVEDFRIRDDTDFGCFDRTLSAYALAYGCDPSNIQYTVDYDVMFSPEFRLCLPRYRKKYSVLELLSVFRALRYNETFHSISFHGINLHEMHGVYDLDGYEHMAITTRYGIDVKKYMSIDPSKKSLLYKEIQALILKSHRLEKLDFTDCLPKRDPIDYYDVDEPEDGSTDPGCEIVSSLMPMGRAELPSVSWLNLTGVTLGEVDIEYMRCSLQKPQSKIRAIEMSRCKLDDRLIMQVITNMERQYATVECIDISKNPGRIDLESFQRSMTHYTKLKVINLAKTFWTTSDEPMFIPKVMLTWKLEELYLDGVSINAKTVEAIAAYLASENSDNLRTLHLNQCNLTGTDVALLMHSMCRKPGEIRNLELHVNSNKLERGINEITKAIKMQHAPTRFFMRMVEFEKEDHFRELLTALRSNKTIKRLDLAKASLPQDADDDTCEELRLVFKENETLEYLDISGEQSHLETTRFGVGLTYALTGLIENSTLESLRIEYQNLGVQGADTLASVIEKNTGLRHIYCDKNEITLQGYTSIVNALTKNYTLLELPVMKNDGYAALDTLRRSALGSNVKHAWNDVEKDKGPTLRQKLKGIGNIGKKPKQETTEQDFAAAAQYLSERWDFQINRLQKLLIRNAKIKAGAPGYSSLAEADSKMDEEYLRPSTALSDLTVLEQVKSHTTPRVERKDPYETPMSPLTRSEGGNGKFEGIVEVKVEDADVVLVDGSSVEEEDFNEDDDVTARFYRPRSNDPKITNGYLLLDPPEHRSDASDSTYRPKKMSFETGDDTGIVRQNSSKATKEGVVLPELRLPSNHDGGGEKFFELSESERAVFAGLES